MLLLANATGRPAFRLEGKALGMRRPNPPALRGAAAGARLPAGCLQLQLHGNRASLQARQSL